MNKVRKFPLPANPDSSGYGLGILTDECDYRVCWLLNQTFHWNLTKTDDLLITLRNNPVAQSFSCFVNPADQLLTVKLISNHSHEGIWLTEPKQIDFLLIITGQATADTSTHELKATITSKIPQIRGLFNLPLTSFCYL